MGRNIDLTKKLSEEDKEWLRGRARGYQVDENERFLADKDNEEHAPGEVEEPEWTPSNTVASPPFDEPGPNPRQVPRPVGLEHAQVEGEEVEEVDVDELTVDELKDELRALDEPVSGDKAELQKRLKKALK